MITSFVKAFFLQTKSGPKHSIPVSKSRQECCYRGGMAEILLACRNPSERYENSLCWSCWPLGSKLDTHAIFCKTWDIRVELQEQLIDLQYDNEFKVFFKKDHYDLFWCQIVDKYHLLWKEPRMWVLSFPTSYLVEKGFSAVNLMLSKQRNRLLLHERGDLRLYLTKMYPNVSKLCEVHQAHLSHWSGEHTMSLFSSNKII